MNTKVFILSCLLSCSLGAPAADAEADPQLLAAPYHAVAASNCVTEHDVLTTQLCTPSTENVCTTETVDTEEIEYEKVCTDVVSKICDAPAIAAPLAPVAPVATAVGHSVTTSVTHACREVTTEHCVDNPKVKLVPVEVEHCHAVTKVSCSDVENKIPKTIWEPVETTHVVHAVAPALGYFGRK